MQLPPKSSGRGAGAAIHKEEVLHRIVGDEEIHPAIIIYVHGD